MSSRKLTRVLRPANLRSFAIIARAYATEAQSAFDHHAPSRSASAAVLGGNGMMGMGTGAGVVAKDEGSIASVFTSMSGRQTDVWTPRFAALKREMWKEELVETWRSVLAELKDATAEIVERKGEMIPSVAYADIANGLSEHYLQEVRRAGCVIVRGGVPREEALGWKKSIKEYVELNRDRVRGFPADDIVFYELYNSKAQTAARTHPALIQTQRVLLSSLWHVSDPEAPICLDTPIAYYDRLRIRMPGAIASLGPHIDGGSIERWEDPAYRHCYSRILSPSSTSLNTPDASWTSYDPWDAAPRLQAQSDLYNTPNQCSIFRCFQGWTSLSDVGPGEGTLRVLPSLKVSTAYVMLRPFFRPKARVERGGNGNGVQKQRLGFDDWEVDDGPVFPGSDPGRGQEMTPESHPHLRLEETMVSLPRVEPGDQVYWHTDCIHAVEEEHQGKEDSSVLYIPAACLTDNNAQYLKRQRTHFALGLPAPDFPGGEGESKMSGTSKPNDVTSLEGRRLLGLAPFELLTGAQPGARKVIEDANKLLEIDA